jgi:hypothetical protein
MNLSQGYIELSILSNTQQGKARISDNTAPCHQLPDVCLFCLDMYIYTYVRIYTYMCDALSKGHSMCARAKGNHHIIHPILASIRTRLFLSLSLFPFFFLYVVLSHSRCRFSNKRMHFFFLFHIYTYIHTSDAYKQRLLSRTKIFLSSFFFSLSLSLSHIYTLAIEKKNLAAECEKRTRLSILRNNV